MSDRSLRFDQAYLRDPDPWNFTSCPYERKKYQATLSALPRSHYRLGIEAGCSIGELTRLLACRCDRLIGIDVSAVAIEEARSRNADRSNISFLQSEIPSDWPETEADLIVLSEVLYYLTPLEIEMLAERIADRLPAGGDCVLVNYLGNTGEKLQGAKAAGLFVRAMTRRIQSLRHTRQGGDGYRFIRAITRRIQPLRHPRQSNDSYRIDVLSKPAGCRGVST